jgi:LPS sulfotransferase NodH
VRGDPARPLSRAAVTGPRPDPSSRRPFVVVGKARCGSSLLLSLLNSHPHVLGFGEIFRDSHRIGWDLPDYDRDCQTPALVETKRADPVAFLEHHVFEVTSPVIRAVGFKLFYYHGTDSQGRRLWEHLASRENLHVIHMKRNNTLRELLSMKRAELTGEWSQWESAVRKIEPITLDADTCREEFEYAETAKRDADAFFARRPMLQVTYEDLVGRQSSETERVQRFLGVDVRELRSAIVKQSNDALSAAIANYPELRNAFRGTKWEVFFDDAA